MGYRTSTSRQQEFCASVSSRPRRTGVSDDHGSTRPDVNDGDADSPWTEKSVILRPDMVDGHWQGVGEGVGERFDTPA